MGAIRALVAVALALSLTGVSSGSAVASEPNIAPVAKVKKYKSCKQLNKDYKNGVALSKYFARRAVEQGFLRPKVKRAVYWKNERLEDRDHIGFLCPKPPPLPKLNEPSAVGSFQAVPMRVSYRGDSPGIGLCFDAPGLGNEREDATYDIFLNGQVWKEGVEAREFASSSSCLGIFPTIEVQPLAAGTTYTVGIRARNALGVGPILEAVATTPPQVAFDRYGQTLITYEVSGSGGNYSYTIETSSGGTSQGYTGNGAFYEDWFVDDKFVYVSVQNQNSSGSVTCTIKRNGEVYQTTTSNGAYVIATCSGRS